jgi:protein gp37
LGPVDLINLSVDWGLMSGGIDWIICGGEGGADPMDEALARHVRDQCFAAGVEFYMKQMGGRINKQHCLKLLPVDLRYREIPEWI